MSEITPQELKARLDSNDAPLLLDVRQEWETQLCRLPNAVHIPIEEAMQKVLAKGLPARANPHPKEDDE